MQLAGRGEERGATQDVRVATTDESLGELTETTLRSLLEAASS